MGAAPSIALADAVPAARIFSAGVAAGFKVGVACAAVKDALDSVYDAAEAVIGYLRAAASWALGKLKAAAAFVKDTVMRLLRRMFGRKEAAAAKDEMDRAAGGAQQAHEVVVLSRASARVAGSGQRLLDAKQQQAAAAARRASEMTALVEAVYAKLRDCIPEDARSCISVVLAAVGIGLEAIAAALYA